MKMCKQLSTEYFLGSLLSLKKCGISISDLNKFENNIYQLDSEIIIDLCKSSITSVLETHNKYFKCENDIVSLTDAYASNIDKVKYMFYEVLDGETKKTLANAIL